MSAPATYVVVYLVLLGLLGTTVGTYYLQLGALGVAANLGIAAAKALLIAWFFMHLREVSGLVRLFALGGLFWLAILFGLSLSDYLTRGLW